MRAALLLAALALPAPGRAALVNDVSRLNPIEVERVVHPKSIDEIRALVREHPGPVSIGGARHSMGGQIAAPGALFLDMRSLNRIVAYSPKERVITAEAGATWRQIQERIDPDELSVKIMQTYANFTVGGSLSVNAHGRYVNEGPLIRSVREIELVLADGSLVKAGPKENAELFYGAIGGYGGLGVIVTATLELAENAKIERVSRKLAVSDYRRFFMGKIKGSPLPVFHNGDIYPPDYRTVMATTYSKTARALTVSERLQPVRERHWLERFAFLWISEMPWGKQSRAKLIDPVRLHGSPVMRRNYEASYDAEELEPASRELSTYLLQEYFIPVRRFDLFVPKMAQILRRHRANVINVSIRHAEKDPGSLLAWAREECFAFVVYYKQTKTPQARAAAGVWTRELIDAALSLGGSYYLPYEIFATDAQFHRAYPRAKEFFALKRKMDPGYKFRNRLWDRYYSNDAPPHTKVLIPRR